MPPCQWPFANFYTCIHVHACMCMHVGTLPHAPRCPQIPFPLTRPLPRATGSPKHQNSISLGLIKIIWFCLKIIYLWTFLNSYMLLNLDWFCGSPLGGGWVDGDGVGVGVWGVSHAHMHVHTCMHMHACMHMHVKHDKHGCLHGGGHLQFLYMYTCTCMCVHVHMCGDIPHAPRHHHSPVPSPEPQEAQNTKIQ